MISLELMQYVSELRIKLHNALETAQLTDDQVTEIINAIPLWDGRLLGDVYHEQKWDTVAIRFEFAIAAASNEFAFSVVYPAQDNIYGVVAYNRSVPLEIAQHFVDIQILQAVIEMVQRKAQA